MAAPAAAIVAGAITIWLAIASADGLVADDYYRRGLAINQDLRLQEQAVQRGIVAHATLAAAVLRVELSGAAPEALFAQLVHTTRPGYDQKLRLAPVAPGVYQAELLPLAPGRWRMILEDPRREWKIVKEDL
jgi:hypothetical protein